MDATDVPHLPTDRYKTTISTVSEAFEPILGGQIREITVEKDRVNLTAQLLDGSTAAITFRATAKWAPKAKHLKSRLKWMIYRENNG